MMFSTKRINLYFTICFHALLLCSLNAQITGKLVNENGDPIAFANAILYKSTDSTFVNGIYTDENGIFSLAMPEVADEYFIEYSGIGFQNKYSNTMLISQEHSKIDLEITILKEESLQLNEVVVSARKNLIQNTSTGRIINIQGSLMTKGSNAMQVLEKLPGVVVDKQNNQFSLLGQSGVTILFNGRKINLPINEIMTILEATLADGIEKIELITSPSAKYDAEGGAGLINIVFKKNEFEGSQGSLSLGLGLGVKEKANGGFTYAYNKNKFGINMGYSYLHNNSKNGFEGSGVNDASFSGGKSFGTFSTYFNNLNKSQNANVDFTYAITKKTELGLSLNYLNNTTKNTSNVFNTKDFTNGEYLNIYILSQGRSRKNNAIASLFLDHKIDKNSGIKMDLNLINYANSSPGNINSHYTDRMDQEVKPQNEIYVSGYRSKSNSSIDIGTFSLDYYNQFFKNLSSEFGVKTSFGNNKNDSSIETLKDNVWKIDPRSQSIISGHEILIAAYSQFKLPIGEKYQLSFGLRHEYWKRTVSTNEKPFVINKLFPSFQFSTQINENTLFKIDYNKRISRPTYVDLIASLFYNDPTAIFTGNPLLKPTLVDIMQVQLSWKGLNFGISAQKDINPIIRYQLTTNENADILIVSPQNADYQKSLNAFTTIPWHWAKWAEFSLTSITSLRKYKVSYSPNPAEKTYVNQSFNFNQNFNLPKNIGMELSGFYNSAAFEGTNSRKGFGVLNFGISKKIHNGTLQFAINDLFKSFNIYTHISGMTPIVFGIDTNSWYRDESAFSRIYRLTYSTNFGGKAKKKEHKFGAEEENQRVN